MMSLKIGESRFAMTCAALAIFLVLDRGSGALLPDLKQIAPKSFGRDVD